MASPFAIFRKHQKVLIATLAVLAMFAFVFLPITLQQLGLRARGDPVVVETTMYGDLHQSQIEGLRERRQAVINFLRRVAETAVLNGGTGKPALDALKRLGPEPLTEQALVDSWLCSRYAARLGLVVSDEAINSFIKEISEDLIPWDQFTRRKGFGGQEAGLFEQVGVSSRQMFELLRQELLGWQLRTMFWISLAGTTPGQRWDYFTRLKRLATVEVLAVPVANYVDQIDDPGNEELQKFFEEYKDNEARPDSPEPGFRKPRKIAVAYFQADCAKFMGPDVVSDEDVRNHYEQNRDYYDRLADAFEKGPLGKEGPLGQQPKESTSATGQEESKEPAQGPSDEAPKQPGEKKAEEAHQPAPATGAAQQRTSDSQERPSDTQDKPSASENKPSDSPNGPSDPQDSSSAGTVSPFLRVSLLQDQSGPQQPAPEPKQPAPEPEQPAPEAKPPAAGPQLPAAGPQLPAAGAEQPEAQKDTAAAAAQPEGKTQEPPAYPPGRTPEEVKKLLEGPVGQRIRRDLANAKIGEIFGRLQGMMNQYRNKWIRYEVDRDAGKETGQGGTEEPQQLDFKALAKANGLTTGTTPLMSQLELLESAEYDIGRSLVNQQVPFLEYAFDPSQQLYLAAESWGLDKNSLESVRFLFWKTKETEPRPEKPEAGADQSLWHGVPKFEDDGVRQEVLRAYKLVQARSLATERAERFAEEARQAGKPLEDVFPDRDVTVTRPFSWLTYGNVPAGTSSASPRLSEVDGVQMAGRDFMRTVFELEKGEVGVAMNQPKTVAYVVRVVDATPSRQVLEDQFEVDPVYKYRDVELGEQGQMYQAWQRELRSSAGLTWVRKPDQRPEQ